jgi:hypothetical protein
MPWSSPLTFPITLRDRRDLCPAVAADLFIERARRVAESLVSRAQMAFCSAKVSATSVESAKAFQMQMAPQP